MKCVSEVSSGSRSPRYYPCGKPAKGEIDGKPACGIHLAAKRKSEERAAEYAAERKASEESERRIRDLVARLGMGSAGFTSRNRGSGYDHVKLTPAEAEALIAKLDGK